VAGAENRRRPEGGGPAGSSSPWPRDDLYEARRATDAMSPPPSDRGRHSQSNDGDPARGAGNPARALIIRRRRAVDAVRRARRDGRVVSQPKRADHRPRPTGLARAALRAMRGASDDGA
jgi:hypothetical protein